MKGFVGIDVAHARDRALVEEQCLDRRGPPDQGGRQFVGGWQIEPGIGPETGHTRFLELFVREHSHKPEGAGIDEADLGPIIEHSSEVGMGCQRDFFGLHRKPPDIPEMSDERLTVVEGSDQELALASHRLHPTPEKALLHLTRRPVVARGADMGHCHRFESAARHCVIQMTTGDLDFGQLGHSCTPTRAGYRTPPYADNTTQLKRGRDCRYRYVVKGVAAPGGAVSRGLHPTWGLDPAQFPGHWGQ